MKLKSADNLRFKLYSPSPPDSASRSRRGTSPWPRPAACPAHPGSSSYRTRLLDTDRCEILFQQGEQDKLETWKPMKALVAAFQVLLLLPGLLCKLPTPASLTAAIHCLLLRFTPLLWSKQGRESLMLGLFFSILYIVNKLWEDKWSLLYFWMVLLSK